MQKQARKFRAIEKGGFFLLINFSQILDLGSAFSMNDLGFFEDCLGWTPNRMMIFLGMLIPEGVLSGFWVDALEY